MRKLSSLCAALLAAACLWTQAGAHDFGDLTDSQRESLRAEIRDYLVSNPDVILEAIQILTLRQEVAAHQSQAALIDRNSREIFADGRSWSGGNPDGDIVLVEFFDYRCGYCKKAFPIVEEFVRADGNVRFVLKEYPVLGSESALAARLAIATKMVEGDDAYKEIHDALMEYRGPFRLKALISLIDDFGYNSAEIVSVMESGEISGVIRDNKRLASDLGISGTPSFVIEDRIHRGTISARALRDLVSELRRLSG